MAAEHRSRVGGRIAQAREAKGWSQRELARQLPGKVDGPSVSRWETGKVYPEQYIDALAEALDVDVSYFLAPAPEPGTPDLMGALADADDADIRSLVIGLGQEVQRLREQIDRLERREDAPPDEETG